MILIEQFQVLEDRQEQLEEKYSILKIVVKIILIMQYMELEVVDNIFDDSTVIILSGFSIR